mgnify:CR=1 FL=1
MKAAGAIAEYCLTKNTSRGTAFAKAAIRQAQALNKGMGTSPALTNTVCV